MAITAGKRRLILLCLALCMAGASILLVKVYLHQKAEELKASYADHTEKGAVVVARLDVPAGTRITMDNFAVRKMPLDMIPPDAIAPSDIERAEGQSLKIGLPMGRPLLWGYLSSGTNPSFSDLLQADRRALTIAVDELNSISGMIRPDDRIDLFIVSKEKDDLTAKNERVVMPLLQDVLVKATGNIVRRETLADGREYDRRYSTLTLDLLPDEIGRVLIAQENGDLKAALKRPEQSAANYQPTREADLWAKGDKEKGGVTFYVGGKGASSNGILKSEVLPYSSEAIAGAVAKKVRQADDQEGLESREEIARQMEEMRQREEREEERAKASQSINTASAGRRP